MKKSERDNLIDELIEDSISEADFLRLEAELCVDSTARQEYYRRNALTMLLENVAGQRPTAPELFTSSNSTSAQPNTIFSALAIATCISLLALGAWWFSAPPKDTGGIAKVSPRVGEEEMARGYGVLVGQVAAKWANGQSLANGALLPLDKMMLESGAAQIELFSGVELVVEGKAEFQVLSPMEVALTSGKLRANVPEPAHGFRVQTARGTIVDLGTEFALDVSDAESELHVLQGEIEWQPTGEQVQRILGGQGVRHADGRVNTLVAVSAKFLSTDQLRIQSASDRSSRRKAWEQYVKELRQDDRLVALYQMGVLDRWQRRLPNQAIHAKGMASEGAIVAADRVSGRWSETGAVSFSPTGSRVRLNISGEFGSMTMMCWVRINSLDRWYNSLFLTDGHEQHEPHWQIMDDGRLFFSVKKRDTWDVSKGEEDKHIYYSPPFWDTTLSGQWLMIATVYNIESRHVTHYLNGEQLSREEIPDEYLVPSVRIGNASLGNWGLPERNDPQFSVRNFNGSMDEFALFSAALSPEEIKGHYENGKP